MLSQLSAKMAAFESDQDAGYDYEDKDEAMANAMATALLSSILDENSGDAGGDHLVKMMEAEDGDQALAQFLGRLFPRLSNSRFGQFIRNSGVGRFVGNQIRNRLCTPSNQQGK